MRATVWVNVIILLKWEWVQEIWVWWNPPQWTEILVWLLTALATFELCLSVGALIDERWEKNPPNFD